MYDFGSRLKAIRNQRGLTQKKLAEEIGKSVQAVSSYERNSQIPPIEVMISIADVLNVSLDYLVDRQPANQYSFCNIKSIHKEMATHSSTLAWKIPWTEEAGRLPSMGSHRVGHD